MKIAVLYTCFNRKEKTLSSLNGLYVSQRIYNRDAQDQIELEVFLTDDGCTDGTAEAINQTYPDKKIHILNGTGNLYWAGGMRYAWNEAMKRHDEWDFYLLLNDDTDIFGYCLSTLIKTHEYCLSQYRKSGIYSGITCGKSDMNTTTYGGRIIKNRFMGTWTRAVAASTPALVHQTNANILMVSKQVVDEIGIFYEGYRHGNADFDYAMTARRHGIPVLLTASHCGACDNDHVLGADLKSKILSMTQAERSAFFANPLHSSQDYLTFIRRNIPIKYPFTWIFRKLQEHFPKVYYFINKR